MLCLFTLEPSPFTPLLSLKAYFRPKWHSKILISPTTNRFRSPFDILGELVTTKMNVKCLDVTPFLLPAGYGPSFDTFLTKLGRFILVLLLLLTKLFEARIAAEIVPVGIDSQHRRRHRVMSIGDAE